MLPFVPPACVTYFYHCQRVTGLHKRITSNSLSAHPVQASNLGHKSHLTKGRNKTLAKAGSSSLSQRDKPAPTLLEGLFSYLHPERSQPKEVMEKHSAES